MQLNPIVVVDDFRTFFSMFSAILHKKYKMPWRTFFWAVVCLIYLISPLDLLPDFLPLLGIADDGAFVVLILTMLHKDLAAYRKAQAERENIVEAEIVDPKK